MSARPVADSGVFETLLVRGGRPVELEAHLARMGASLRSLYGSALPADAVDLVLRAAAEVELGRVRLDATPGHASVRAVPVADEVVFPARGPRLRRLVVPGGIGAHKWADRRLLATAEADFGPDALPLLLDDDGTVLEASRANVFLAVSGTLVTPVADGRLLPGITRARVIELAREAGLDVRERVVALDELESADEVFLTGAVRGVEPVRGLDGGPDWDEGSIAPLLADRLRWLWGCLPVEEGSR